MHRAPRAIGIAAAGSKRLRILNETPGPVETLAAKLCNNFTGLEISLDERFDDAGLVVNIIAARRTELMQASATRGLRVVNGVAMIRHQLPLQTAFWRGEA